MSSPAALFLCLFLLLGTSASASSDYEGKLTRPARSSFVTRTGVVRLSVCVCVCSKMAPSFSSSSSLLYPSAFFSQMKGCSIRKKRIDILPLQQRKQFGVKVFLFFTIVVVCRERRTGLVLCLLWFSLDGKEVEDSERQINIGIQDFFLAPPFRP